MGYLFRIGWGISGMNFRIPISENELELKSDIVFIVDSNGKISLPFLYGRDI